MIELLEQCDLKNYTVVFPSVSVGNVGQLSADLLISSLKLKKLGYVWHPSVLPFAGVDAFENSDAISTGCELFYSQSLRLIIFQIRSAIVKNKTEFLENICTWLKSNYVSQVIILSGMSAHERRDQQLIGEPLRYVFCPLTKSKEGKNAETRNWIELESKELNVPYSYPNFIPGSGIAVKLFDKCIKESLPCSMLFEFCSDGNNIPDALKLVNYLDEWLELKEKSETSDWVIPPSWSLLFGPSPPSEIFN